MYDVAMIMIAACEEDNNILITKQAQHKHDISLCHARFIPVAKMVI